MRTIDQAVREFEALKPVVIKLRTTNSLLRTSAQESKIALALSEKELVATELMRSNEQRLRINAEDNWKKYQIKSTQRGWTSVGLAAVLLLVIVYGHR